MRIPPILQTVSQAPVLWTSIAVAALGAAGGAGALLESRGSSGHAVQAPQYELWSPNSLNSQNKELVVFKYDKTSGKAWRLEDSVDAKKRRLSWTWSRVLDLAPKEDSSARVAAR